MVVERASIRVWAVMAAAILATGLIGFAFTAQYTEAQTSSTPTYTVTDLGTLGGNHAVAHDINESGQVVGSAQRSDGQEHAFLYDDDQMQDLGILGTAGYSSAEGLNDAGKVVGTSSIGANQGEHGFLYDGSQMQDIGGGSAVDINNSDQIARTACEGGNPFVQACLYKDGQKTYLGTLGGPQSYAHGLNNSGSVVGRSDAWTQWGYNRPQAFLYQSGSIQDIRPSQDDSDSWALDINDNGKVLGFHRDGFTGLWQGFVYANGQHQNLGTPSGELQSFPLDINNNNQIVGSSDGSGWEQGNAILYDENGKWHNLNDLIPSDSGLHLLRAEAINDEGQIVGWGLRDGVTDANKHRAFLLTPGSSTPSDTTGPVVTPPEDVTVEATGPDGAIATYSNVTATDETDGPVSVTCDPPSGTKFALGTTEVTCTATDAAGNNGSATFNVTVEDTTKPDLTLPSDITEKTTSSSGKTVSYTAPSATDKVDSSVSVVCDGPTSGSNFPLGTTTINCEATDDAGNKAPGSFKVNVVYDFGNGSGGSFGEPVKDTELNQVKASQGVPVKFGLGANLGLNIFASGYPTSKKIDCSTGLPTDPVEETVSITKSGLQYDSASGLYTYGWKTEKAWSGTCRELNLKLADGTNHPVKFQFK